MPRAWPSTLGAMLLGALPLLSSSTALAAPLIIYDRADVEQKEASSQLDFRAALERAIMAYATDMRGSSYGQDSVLGLVLSAPEMFGLAADADPSAGSSHLLNLLKQDPAAEIILLTPGTVRREEYRFAPESGESLDANWVFRVRLPTTMDILIWSIVPETGEAYAYAIE